jgi:uncharacterized protein (DUF2252 family)
MAALSQCWHETEKDRGLRERGFVRTRHDAPLQEVHVSVKLLDAAYWMKGCNSLGQLRCLSLELGQQGQKL